MRKLDFLTTSESSETGLSPARAKYFFDLGLFAEAEFIANAVIDECLKLLSEAQTEKADIALGQLIGTGITVRHLHYLKGLCLIELNKYPEAKVCLETELKIDPQNHEAKNLLDQLVAELANAPTSDSVLLVGPVAQQKLVECLEAEIQKPENKRNLFILIETTKPDSEYLGGFEQQCNQAISQRQAWGFVKMLRGKMPEALTLYKEILGSTKLFS